MAPSAGSVRRRFLRVDLTTGRLSVERPEPDFMRLHMGGRNVIAHTLLSEVPPEIDAFDPENRLVFALGPITGVSVPGGSRHSVGAKSPLTGLFGESEAGGYWGAELKRAGWDAIIVQGRAAHPVYLWIHDDEVELRDARPLWGKLTGPVEDRIRAELADPQVRVAQIGPAGENLVRFACVVHDLNEVAGRTGLGAVMGSKNLKAIAVRGTQPVSAADPRAIAGVARWVAQETLAPGEPHHRLHTWGTGAMVKSKQLEGHLVAHNFRDGRLPGGDQVDALAVQDLAEHEMDRCYACSVRCKKRVKVTRPDLEVDPKYGGPEYETMAAIGPNTGVVDVMAVCKGHEMLNALGMDSISCGATIAWAMEMVELGLMDKDRLSGESLHFGSADDLLRVIGKIARREGVGDLLAEGSLRAARTLGAEAEVRVVHVKGLEVAMHDPRAMPEMRRNYPVTPTGGDHTGAAGKRSGLRNTVGLCHFLQYDEAMTLTLLNAATGWEVSPDELHATFERGVTMARLFNLREGLKPEDDRLPDRLHQPLRHGPLRDRRLSRDTVRDEVRAYYRDHGWDPATGRPYADTIEYLGLDSVAAAAQATEFVAERREPLPAGRAPYAPQPEESGVLAE
ncbi:MAG: aldehyde ferredoxin oxidoreductase family protein [Chloroflexi bacterium]|nr:aldehyde ferredoxin oxidoreductase family protein [Chloroflexota bacterium]